MSDALARLKNRNRPTVPNRDALLTIVNSHYSVFYQSRYLDI
jgi:hypothetical protein